MPVIWNVKNVDTTLIQQLLLFLIFKKSFFSIVKIKVTKNVLDF